jgi:uncharacterized coiled-coil DUF342 family protein
MIKLKISELIYADSTLQALMNAEGKTIKQAYWLNKLLKAFTPEYESYNKAINDLKQECCEIDPETNDFKVEVKDNVPFYTYKSDKLKEKFTKETQELWDSEIEVNFDPIDVSIFEGLKYSGPIGYLDKFLK